jgi:hypothetical protein
MRYLKHTKSFTLALTSSTYSATTGYILRRVYHNNTTADFEEGQSSNNGTISDWQQHLESTVISDPRTVSIQARLDRDTIH